MATPLHIDELFAFVAVDDSGNEGVTAFLSPSGWMPMVGADLERIDQFRDMAQRLADTSGKPITLARFTTRTDSEVITPDPPAP